MAIVKETKAELRADAAGSATAPLEAEAPLPPGYEQISGRDEFAYIVPTREKTTVILGENHSVVLSLDETNLLNPRVFLRFPELVLPTKFFQSDEEIDPKGIELKWNCPVTIARGDPDRPWVYVFKAGDGILIRIPTQVDEGHGTSRAGTVNFSDFNGPITFRKSTYPDQRVCIKNENREGGVGFAVPDWSHRERVSWADWRDDSERREALAAKEVTVHPMPVMPETGQIEVVAAPELEISSVVEIGSVKPGMIPTLLEGGVFEKIHEYLSRDTRNEQGGFVIFHVETDPILKRQVARVKDFIPSHLGKATGVSFQWVSNDFTEAHQYVDQKWPRSMLGFIHSHPGMSVGPTGETLDSLILKGYCQEPFIPFLIYDPINRAINDLRWDGERNQAVSVGGILFDQAGLKQETALEFVDTDFFGSAGRSYRAALSPSGKSLEESIEIGEVSPPSQTIEAAPLPIPEPEVPETVAPLASGVVTGRIELPEEAITLPERQKSWREVALEMAQDKFARIGFRQTGNEIVAAAAFEFRTEITEGKMNEEMFTAMMREINGIAKSYEARLGQPPEQKLEWPQTVEDMGKDNIAGTAFDRIGSRIVAAAAYRFRQGIRASRDQGASFKRMIQEINGVAGRYRQKA